MLLAQTLLFAQKQKTAKTPDQKELQAELEKELKELEEGIQLYIQMLEKVIL